MGGSNLSQSTTPTKSLSSSSLGKTSPPPQQSYYSKFNFRVRVFSKETDKSILSVLRTLSSQKKLDSFDNFKSRGKSTLDFLFETGDEANAAYTKVSQATNELKK